MGERLWEIRQLLHSRPRPTNAQRAWPERDLSGTCPKKSIPTLFICDDHNLMVVMPAYPRTKGSMMHIAVFGANGPTGQHVTKQALDAGHTVTAVTRHPETFPIRHERLRVARADVLDLAAVERAVAGQDAVLSTLGVPFSRQPITVYSQGVEHIMRAMSQYGVHRLVCVSSSATDPQTRYHDTGGGFVFEKLLKPLIIKTIGRTTYADMQRMEALVMHSQLDWVIVRPSGLFETAAITNYQVAEATIRGQFTSRSDLADCMLRQLTSDRFLGKAVAVATFAERPKLLQFFGGEAFQRTPNPPRRVVSPADASMTAPLPGQKEEVYGSHR